MPKKRLRRRRLVVITVQQIREREGTANSIFLEQIALRMQKRTS